MRPAAFRKFHRTPPCHHRARRTVVTSRRWRWTITGTGALLDCDVASTQRTVLRDEVAARTTPHEVTSRQSQLNGHVQGVSLPTSRMVFVRYGGDVVVEAPATGDRLVATLPFGPMVAHEGRAAGGATHTGGFLLSQRDTTVMQPDPWRGALVVASDPDRLARHTALVVDHADETRSGDIVGLIDSPLLEQACRNIWSMVTTLPDETPESVVCGLMNVLEEQLLTALVLTARRSTAPCTGDVRVDELLFWLEENFASPIALSDMAVVVGVSIRRMQEAVRRATGQTPTELLRDIRLGAAHRALRNADPHVTSVAAVAHACGIAHLGRFALQYRERFGCAPSSTLGLVH